MIDEQWSSICVANHGMLTIAHSMKLLHHHSIKPHEINTSLHFGLVTMEWYDTFIASHGFIGSSIVHNYRNGHPLYMVLSLPVLLKLAKITIIDGSYYKPAAMGLPLSVRITNWRCQSIITAGSRHQSAVMMGFSSLSARRMNKDLSIGSSYIHILVSLFIYHVWTLGRYVSTSMA
jgi:hypothetical protein